MIHGRIKTSIKFVFDQISELGLRFCRWILSLFFRDLSVSRIKLLQLILRDTGDISLCFVYF